MPLRTLTHLRPACWLQGSLPACCWGRGPGWWGGWVGAWMGATGADWAGRCCGWRGRQHAAALPGWMTCRQQRSALPGQALRSCLSRAYSWARAEVSGQGVVLLRQGTDASSSGSWASRRPGQAHCRAGRPAHLAGGGIPLPRRCAASTSWASCLTWRRNSRPWSLLCSHRVMGGCQVEKAPAQQGRVQPRVQAVCHVSGLSNLAWCRGRCT